MEYYCRCSKCGRRTPSFDYEDYLKDYALDWKITEDEKICDKCLAGEKSHVKYMRRIEYIMWAVLAIVLIGICWLTF